MAFGFYLFLITNKNVFAGPPLENSGVRHKIDDNSGKEVDKGKM